VHSGILEVAHTDACSTVPAPESLRAGPKNGRVSSRTTAVEAWRDLAIALSLANLCYLRIWGELLAYAPRDAYLMKSPPPPAAFGAVMLNVLLLGSLLWLIVTVARRTGSAVAIELVRWVLVLFTLALLLATELRGVVLTRLLSLVHALLGQRVTDLEATMILGVLCAAPAVTAFRFSPRLLKGSLRLVLIICPFVVITFAQAIAGAFRYDPAPFRDKPLAAALAVNRTAPRVLWVICDEWDQRLTFTDRKPGLRLAEIDRLRHQALYAENAYPPLGEGTLAAMPSLTVGEQVVPVRQLGPAELSVRLAASGKVVPWNSLPNVFSRAREAGFNTAVVGWYHPYCRVLNESLTACWWWEAARQHNSMGERLPELLLNQPRRLFETSLLSPFGQSLMTHQHIRTYRAMLERAEQVAADPQYGLSLVHLPVPHAPHFYDASSGQFTRSNSRISGYWDSLQLLDRTLGELRRAMEGAGTWDATAILLSADHSFRVAFAVDGKMDPRIPFLLKLPGQRVGVSFTPRFSAIVTHDLLLGILRGELRTPEAVVGWLEKRKMADREPVLPGLE